MGGEKLECALKLPPMRPPGRSGYPALFATGLTLGPMSDLIPLPDPQFKFFADLRVEVGTPQEVGHTVHGL
eukprot:gene28833-50730_t